MHLVELTENYWVGWKVVLLVEQLGNLWAVTKMVFLKAGLKVASRADVWV